MKNRKLYIPLNLLPIGESAQVKWLNCCGTQLRRMLDLGLINGTCIKALYKSPLGDPTAYQIRGTVFALRLEEASLIFVEKQ